MEYVRDLIDGGNVFGLLFGVLILVWVGQHSVERRPHMKLWGLRIATGFFAVFSVLYITEYGAYSTGELLSALFTGLVAGGLTLGPAWIALACIDVAAESYRRAARSPRDRRELRRSERERRRSERKVRTPPAAPSAAELREREAAAKKRQQEEAQKQKESADREEAIASCEVLFSLRAPEIGGRFTREQFDDFVSKYLGPEKPAEVISERASQLKALIEQHYAAVCPPPAFASLERLAAWYQEQKDQIAALPVEDVYKQDFLVQLNERYADLTQETLEKLS